MALQVWLPLNGNLHNQGLSSVTVTNNGATVDNNGKIGKCYSFNNANYLQISTLTIGDEFSVAYWVKYNDLSYPRTHIGIQHSPGAYTSTNKGWDIGHGPSGGGTYNFDINDGTNIQRMSFSSSNITQLNIWKHFTLTCSLSNKSVKLYIDGVLVGTQTINNNIGSFSTNRVTNIGTLYGWYLNGYLNDFRIYDHCLSPKEVKEISKGLVLHYKLDDPYIEPTVNYGRMNQNVSLIPAVASDWSLERIDRDTLKVTALKDNPSYSTYGNIVTGIGGSKLVEAGNPCTLSCEIVDYRGSLGRIYPGSGGFGSIVGYGEFMGRVYRTITHSVNWSHDVIIRTSDQANIKAGDYLVIRNTQIELKNHATPYTPSSRSGVPVYDSSGYGRNGAISGTLVSDSDTSRYNWCTKFDGVSTRVTAPFNYLYYGNNFTISAWVKSNVNNGGYLSALGTELSNGGIVFGELRTTNTIQCYLNATNGNDICICAYNSFEANKWFHLVYSVSNALSSPSAKLYINGTQASTNTSSSAFGEPDQPIYIGCSSYGASITPYRYWNGQISDVRIYTTSLSADDIKDLYQTAAAIHNTGAVEAFEYNENLSNIALDVEYNRAKKVWGAGLSSYTQPHCQCTLTDDGYRIYRTPDLIYSQAGTVMWGGFVIDNTNNRFNFQTGHTYMLQFEVKGQTSNSVSDIYWTNYVGWGGGETQCSPSNIVISNPVTANYNNSEWKTFTYKWTINDNVWKLCTSSYQSFIAGQYYVSYKGFKYGFGYRDTGSLGTDLYIRNIRMFDITNGNNIEILKSGVTESTSFTEETINPEITQGGLVANQFKEI